MLWFFLFFFISGFCSLMYEVIWLRLAMAQYGVTTPMVSLVLSTFMLGLGLGSWASGRLIKRRGQRITFPPLRIYALVEFLIGLSAFAIVFELSFGRRLLHGLELTHGLSSLAYYWGAALCIAVALLPWCACMGATFPCALFAIERNFRSRSATSFSYLYLANVLGAMAGALLPLLVIEEAGFRHTLFFGAALNFLLALCAFAVALRFRGEQPTAAREPAPSASEFHIDSNQPSERRTLLVILFWTGLTSMAAEVVWVRIYTTWLGTVVYAFAAILALYLGATYLGSLVYRRYIARSRLDAWIWPALALTVLIPLLTADPRLPSPALLRVILGIVPFSAALGFITPCVLDRLTKGDPAAAGSAYGVNILGCILGPLLSGFLLLPAVGERGSLIVLSLPWLFAPLLLGIPAAQDQSTRASRTWGKPAAVAASAFSLVLILFTHDLTTQYPSRAVKRDYTATVVATGSSREGKRLMVNGVAITQLTPETKIMAHLPLALLNRPPKNALDICFGMGTTHRSLLSWGISSTAVELIPSVPSLYGHFHSDGPSLLELSRSHLIIDDGRLFMDRSTELFDVITIDPPPPVEAAPSSLLYSKEFYAAAKRHLPADGILQQWLPNGEPAIVASVAKAIHDSFPYVRVFGAMQGPGLNFLASSSPIAVESPAILAARMPPDAIHDLLEWGPYPTAAQELSATLTREVSIDFLIRVDSRVPALSDDRPINEYFLVRRLSDPAFLAKLRGRLFTARTD